MRCTSPLAWLPAVALLWVAACGDGNGPPPSVVNARVAPNPNNALSTLVSFEAVDAATARVVYWTGEGAREATPEVPVGPGVNTIATLGLAPATPYQHVVEVTGPGGRTAAEAISFPSGDLPEALRDVRLDLVGSPGPGETLTAVSFDTSAFVVAFGEAGEVRWYRRFDEGLPAGEVKQQPNGNITAFLGRTNGWQPLPGRYVEIQPDGEVVASYSAASPFYTDNHELLLGTSGGGVEDVHLIGYEIRTVDLSIFGGSPAAQVAGHLILRQSPSGEVRFSWSAWDHRSVEDWIEPPDAFKQLPEIDFDHPNSIDFDLDGNYVVSFRNLGEVSKIDAATGITHWRLGGRNNQFTILGDPFGGFSGQHCARILENGNLLLYDNGLRHTPPESRAVEYALDPVARTATMVWQYRHDPPIFTTFVGGVQRLASGNTFVSFGGVGHVVEAGPDGRVFWEGDVTAGGQTVLVYRAIRIRSLYEHQPI